MPQAIEESQPQELENYLKKLITQSNKEVYIGFPFQQEAFAMYFEDRFNIFTIYGDVETNNFQLMKDKQFRSPEEWQLYVNRNLRQNGIFCPMSKVNVLVTCNITEGIEFDYDSGTYYKIYKEKPDVLPFSLIMKKRDQRHPLNALSLRASDHPEREL